MQKPPPIRRIPWGVILALVLLGAAAVIGLRPLIAPGDRTGRGPFEYDLSKYMAVDPELIRYAEVRAIPLSLRQPTGVAVGPGDRFYVCGDRGYDVLGPDGTVIRRVDVQGTPACIGVDPDGNVYVGIGGTVATHDSAGVRRAEWPPFDDESMVTAIAAGGADVVVGNAGSHLVLRYDRDGKLLALIGGADERAGVPGLLLPSQGLDVARGPDGSVWVANCGRLSVEHYDADGALLAAWGHAGMTIDAFCGCCNPARLAVLPDGRVVTAEKGLLRVKIYAPDGRLDCVVAEPAQFDADTAEIDLAVTRTGEIVLLDPRRRELRLFAPKVAE